MAKSEMNCECPFSLETNVIVKDYVVLPHHSRWSLGGCNVMKGVLFDFFGTLVNYSTSRVAQGYYATHSLIRECGIDIDYSEFLHRWVSAHEECDAKREASGREYRGVDVAIGFLEGLGPQQWPEPVASQLWRSYVTEWSSGVTYIAGVPEMLQRLSEQYNIGVISNTQDEQLVHELLKKSGAEPYLDVVVTSVEHGTPKPDASIFQRALDMLGCKASEALFVGDSYVHDYVGATNAGLKALLIASTAESRAPRHDTITSVLDVSNYMSLVTAHEEASS